MAGIMAARQTGGPASSFLALAAAGLGLAWTAYRRRKDAPAAAAALFAFAALGAGLAAGAEARFAGHPLRAIPSGAAADIEGVLAQTPSLGLEIDRLVIRVDKVVTGGRTVRVRGRARLTIPRTPRSDRLLAYRAGDRLRGSGTILAPRDYANFGPSFSERYARTQGFHLLASIKSPLLVERLEAAPRLSPVRLISGLRRGFLNVIGRGFADPAAPGGIRPEGAVLEALLLGERGRMDEALTRALQSTGLFHLIAISGAHIGIIAAFLLAVLRGLGLTRRASSMILIGLLVFYGFLVEGRASVVRAVIMAVFFLAGRLAWKDVGLFNTLAASALAILAADPFQLLDHGFTLTYAATLAILLFYEPILKRLPRLPLKLAESTALTLSAQIGALPLTVSAFHRVALSAIPLNYIAVPLVSLIMAAGYVYLPLGLLIPGLARPGGAVLRPAVDLFVRSLGLLDGIPALSYRLPTLPAWVAWAYAAAWLGLLRPGRSRGRRRAAAAAAAFTTGLVILAPFPHRTRDLKITILDVGQGDSILVEPPGADPLLIDGGGSAFGSFDVGESVVSPALWDRRVRRLGIVVLTHAHPDHRRGLLSVARNFRIREFWQGASGPPDAEAEALDRELRRAARWTLAAGAERRLGEAKLEVLWPEAGPGPPKRDENDRSLTLRLTYGHTAFLFPGDIGTGIEERLADSGRDLRADLLKVAHHGSRTSSSDGFLAAVDPEWIVITCGRANSYGLPHPDVMARLEGTGARVLRTDRDGAVEIRSDGRHIAVRSARSAGRERRPD